MPLDDLGDLAPDRHHGVQGSFAGSWKMMPIRAPRTRCMSNSRKPSRSVPPSATEPDAMRPLSGSRRSSEERGHRFSAAGFADERERLAPARSRAKARRPRAQAALGLEHRRELAHLQHRLGRDGAHAGSGASRAVTLRSRARGSNASRTASAKRFAGSTIRNMNRNAAASDHQMTGVAASSRPRGVDHDAEAECLRIDSDADVRQHRLGRARTSENCITVMITTIGATFGRIWRTSTRDARTPNACAAWIYSSSRSFIVSPRTRRHIP
jgi:hypothetical protein